MDSKRYLVCWLDSCGNEARQRFYTRDTAQCHLDTVSRIDAAARIVDLHDTMTRLRDGRIGRGEALKSIPAVRSVQPPRMTKTAVIRSLMVDSGMSRAEAIAHWHTYGQAAVS